MTVTNQELSVSDDSEVRLTLTVAGSSVQECYDKSLRELRRGAQIRGFRRGKVPRDVLVRKFGDALARQVTEQVINETVSEVIATVEQKPLPYLPPRADSERQIVLGEDFTFTVVYDTWPDVKLGDYRGLKLAKPEVAVEDADLERELGNLREQNAVVIEKSTEGDAPVAVEQGDVITVNYVELDDAGAPNSATERRDFVFEVGTHYNLYHMDDELIGMQRGADKEFSKSFPDDWEHRELAGRTVTLRVTVTSVKEKQLPDLDDELAQDISERFETLDDLKNDLRERLRSNADAQIRTGLIEQIMDRVVESSEVPLPKSMVAADMQSAWSGFAARRGQTPQQLAAAIEAGGGSVEAAIEDMRPTVEHRVRRSLVQEALADREKIEVDDDDLDARLNEMAEQRGEDAAQLRTRYESQNMLAYLRRELRDEQLFDRLIAACDITPGARTSYTGYMDSVQANQ
ncbi:MAG: trigger factor [Spirochaetaceae bacterium]|nr:trigger factor [Spirochaetaceae bacterium]